MRTSVAVGIVAAAFVLGIGLCSPASAQGAQVRDAGGALVGLYMGGAGPDTGNEDQGHFQAYKVISSQGYLAAVIPSSGKIGTGFYLLPGSLAGSFFASFTHSSSSQRTALANPTSVSSLKIQGPRMEAT